MKKQNRILVILLCFVSIFLVSCGRDGGYKKNFANKDYVHLFTPEDKEYFSGSIANAIMLKEDKLIISEMVENEMYKQKKSKSESGPEFYLNEREYLNPVYDKENNQIKADELEEIIKVNEKGEIEYKGKIYISDPGVKETENK